MIELESSRAKRFPLKVGDKSISARNFDPRERDGLEVPDPTIAAKVYQKTKEDLEKWLHIRAALLNIDLTNETRHFVDVNNNIPISI